MPSITVPSGTVAYRESGDPDAPVALYLHGVIVNSYLWCRQLDEFAHLRHNIAVDLLGHGASVPAAGQGVTFEDQAEAIAQFLDAKGIDSVDLVANDSGTGIAQIFAVRHPHRVRSLVLSNGDVHDNWPPAAFGDFTAAVAGGELPSIIAGFDADHDAYRGPDGIGGAYQNPSAVTDDEIDAFIEPYVGQPDQLRALEAFINAFDNAQTTRIAGDLSRLNIPALVIWGTGDIFFDLTGADWLERTLPDVRAKVILDDAALLLVSERADEVNAAIGRFWAEL